jgi:hypothetical protein
MAQITIHLQEWEQRRNQAKKYYQQGKGNVLDMLFLSTTSVEIEKQT